MFEIQYSSTGLAPDWEPVPDSRPRVTAEEAKKDARTIWSMAGAKREWIRVIRQGSRKPLLVFGGGRFRLNSGKWQRVPSRRGDD